MILKNKYISKNNFFNTLSCPTLGWDIQNNKILKTQNLSAKFLNIQGVEVENSARKLYSEGYLVKENTNELAYKKTLELMDVKSIKIIFQATFISNNFIAKADILTRVNGSWDLIEIKSGTKSKPEYVDDVSYTTMIVKKAGVKINSIFLMLVSNKYVFGQPLRELFHKIDVTKQVQDRISMFFEIENQINMILTSKNRPVPKLRFICKKCGDFQNCLGESIENHIFHLPRLSEKKFLMLNEMTIRKIEDIPSNFELTKRQSIIRDTVVSKIPFISANLNLELSKPNIPYFYLDFETFSTAIPLFPDLRSYEQIPFQYSVHKLSHIGGKPEHREYLADFDRNCKKELLQNLIRDLEKAGTIFVYTSFEKTVMNRLLSEFSEYADDINSIIDRFVDLEAIIRNYYYHPDFEGSTSIKNTLPALVPSLSYENLELQDGQSAMAIYAMIAKGIIEGEEVDKKENELLEYCKLDTLAMLKLHEVLVSFTKEEIEG